MIKRLSEVKSLNKEDYDKIKQYETEKQKILSQNLFCEEETKRIKSLAKRLNV